MSYTYRECLMQYCKKELPVPKRMVLDCEIESMAPDEDGGVESTYFFYLENTEIGSISIYEEKNTVNIFGVYIEPEFRGNGYSHEMLYSVLEDITSLGKRILLQVADNNIPAFSLYTKCGFEIIDYIQVDTTPN